MHHGGGGIHPARLGKSFCPIHLGVCAEDGLMLGLQSVARSPRMNHTTERSPQFVVPQNRWFTVEKPIKMDDLGYPYFRKHPHVARCFWGIKSLNKSGLPTLSPTALEGGDPKNVTYILKMVKIQVLEILQLPPPQRVQVRYRSQRPKNVTYIFGSL